MNLRTTLTVGVLALAATIAPAGLAAADSIDGPGTVTPDPTLPERGDAETINWVYPDEFGHCDLIPGPLDPNPVAAPECDLVVPVDPSPVPPGGCVEGGDCPPGAVDVTVAGGPLPASDGQETATAQAHSGPAGPTPSPVAVASAPAVRLSLADASITALDHATQVGD